MTDSSAQRPTDLIFQIMEFRTVYLKAVARAAVEIGFRRDLTRDEGQYSLDVLKREFHYNCPWDLALRLRDKQEEGPRVNMISGTAMTLPFYGESITIYIPNRPAAPDVWLEALAAYYEDHPWFLYRPQASRTPEASPSPGVGNRPERSHPHTDPRGRHFAGTLLNLHEILGKANKLADLSSEDFQRMKDLSGNMSRLIGGAALPDGGDSDAISEHPNEGSFQKSIQGPDYPQWSSVEQDRSPTPRFDLGTSLDDFISFAAVMFNVVAMSWANERFRRLITGEDDANKPDGQNKLTPAASSKRTVRLLYQWFGYRYPWQLELKIQSDPNDAKYWRADVTKNQKAGWDPIKSPELMLTLPWMTGAVDANEETILNARNPSVAIMGLVLYNTDGPFYPFTCG